MTTTKNAADIRTQIADIKAAAFGMGHAPNAGQQARLDALRAELDSVECHAHQLSGTHVCSELCTTNICCQGVTAEDPERAAWVARVAR